MQDRLDTLRAHARDRLKQRRSEQQRELSSPNLPPEELAAALDLDGDGRVFLSEVVASVAATVETDLATMEQEANTRFDRAVRRVPSAAGEQISPPVQPPAADGVSRALAMRLAPTAGPALFAVADRNGDGKLDRIEFLHFCYPFLGPLFRDRHARTFIERMDNNTDGVVSSAEFVAGALQVQGDGGNRDSVQGHDFRAELEVWTQEFEDFDLNHDGELNSDEVQKLLSPEHTAHGIAEGYRLVHLADSNGDHELSLDEISNAHRSFQESRLFNFGERAKADGEALLKDMADEIIQHISRVRDEL